MREIPGLVGYHATEAGAIVSVRSGEQRMLKQWLRKGYMVVTVSVLVGGKRRRLPMDVHRLVLLAFKGQAPEGKPQGRHLNGRAVDNRLNNLEWGSAADNSQDALLHGTIGSGERAHHRRLSEAQVRAIRLRLQQGEHDEELAREFGVSRYYPTKLARAQRWSHVAM